MLSGTEKEAYELVEELNDQLMERFGYDNAPWFSFSYYGSSSGIFLGGECVWDSEDSAYDEDDNEIPVRTQVMKEVRKIFKVCKWLVNDSYDGTIESDQAECDHSAVIVKGRSVGPAFDNCDGVIVNCDGGSIKLGKGQKLEIATHDEYGDPLYSMDHIKMLNSDGRDLCVACGIKIVEPYPGMRYCPKCED